MAKKRIKYQKGGDIKKDPDITGPISFLNSYIQSPEFKKRFQGTESDYKQAQDLFLKQASKYKSYTLEKDDPKDPIGSRVGNPIINDTFGVPKDASVILSKPQAKALNADLVSDILPHEYSHTIRNLGFMDQMNFAFANKNPKSTEMFLKWQKDNNKIGLGKDDYGIWLNSIGAKGAHDNSPGENYSDLNSLRWMMYQQGIYDSRKGPMTPEDLKKAKSDPYLKKQFNFKRLQDTFKDEDIIKLNNEVASNNQNQNIPMAKSGIHIKPSHKGLLHKNLGIPEGSPIPASKLAIHPGDSPALKKRKTFAKNAKKWHHAQDGIDLIPIEQTEIQPRIRPNMAPQNLVNEDYLNAPAQLTDSAFKPITPDLNPNKVPGTQTYVDYKNSQIQPDDKKSYNGWAGNAALGALSAIDRLLPEKKSKWPVVKPGLSYNEHAYGTGSQALAKDGLTISKTGYKADSKDKNKKSLRIPSNQITMDNVPHQVLGVDNLGYTELMQPGGEYQFPGQYVDEFPIKAQKGKKMQAGGQVQNLTPQQVHSQLNDLVAPPDTIPGIQIHDSANLKSGSYPKDRIQNLIRAAKTTGVDPYQLVALSLQESGLGTAKPKASTTGRVSFRNKTSQNFLGQISDFEPAQQTELDTLSKSSGIDASYLKPAIVLRDKLKYAKQLGFNDEAMQLQSYNGYGKLKAQNDSNGKPMKYYGQEVPAGGLDMRQNPLYGKRLVSLKNDLMKNKDIQGMVTMKDGGSLSQAKAAEILHDGTAHGHKLTDKQRRYMGWKAGNKAENGATVTPLNDDMVQFNGPSHADGGIKMSYGNQGVEVEGGETGFKSKEDDSFTIFGNMKNPLTGRKYKEDSKMIAKKEQRVDKLLDYSLELINTNNPGDKWEALKFNSGSAMMQGAARKKQELIQSKEHLADLQNAHLQLKDEEDNAKKGRKIFAYDHGGTIYAQDGATVPKQSLATRHNNPGNMKFAKWMEKYGAVKGEPGTDGGVFAKFPTVEAGQAAMKEHLLVDWKNKTVDTAIDQWTGHTPYNQKSWSDLSGKKIKDLSPTEQSKLLDVVTFGEDSKHYNWDGVVPNGPDEPTGRLAGEKDLTDVTIVGKRKKFKFNPDTPGSFGDTQYNPQTVKDGNYNLNLQSFPDSRKNTNAKGLDFMQVLPEIYTAATNKQDPVFMQQYNPELYQPYQVSFQDRRNLNNQTFRGVSQRLTDNPQALSTLAAQKYEADNQVNAEEFRTNQAINNDITNKNVSLLNDAKLKNLGLADTQYVRQSQAKSNTKQIDREVLQSISQKVAQNKLESRTLQVYENLYPNYSYDEQNNMKTQYQGPAPDGVFNWNGSNNSGISSNAQVTVRQDNTGKVVSTSSKYPSSVQSQLQNLKVNQAEVDYNKSFMNWLKNNR